MSKRNNEQTYELIFANRAGDFSHTVTMYDKQRAIDMVHECECIIEDLVDIGDGEVWYVFPNVWGNTQDQVNC